MILVGYVEHVGYTPRDQILIKVLRLKENNPHIRNNACVAVTNISIEVFTSKQPRYSIRSKILLKMGWMNTFGLWKKWV
ncbi:MAG: hypothetical protein CL916_15280 [Deltaproteobacteria bacterium]|nr:hypothetical protein [Deltaproteobacteria bacterium]